MSDCPGSAVSIGSAPLAARVSRVAAGPLRYPGDLSLSLSFSLHFASRYYLDIQSFFSQCYFVETRHSLSAGRCERRVNTRGQPSVGQEPWDCSQFIPRQCLSRKKTTVAVRHCCVISSINSHWVEFVQLMRNKKTTFWFIRLRHDIITSNFNRHISRHGIPRSIKSIASQMHTITYTRIFTNSQCPGTDMCGSINCVSSAENEHLELSK
jgi:hypothetical protein